MRVSERALKQIIEAEREYKGQEYGGYLIIKNNTIDEIIFDEDYKDYGYVHMGARAIMKLARRKRNQIRGWFHRHPIDYESQIDLMTALRLTRWWGKCYTLILHKGERLQMIKTKMMTDFILNTPLVVVERDEEATIAEEQIPEPVGDTGHRFI